MTQTRDLIKKMADFFTGEEFYEKGEDARLELSPDDVRCMNEIIKACSNAISRQAVEEMIKAEMPERGMWEIEGDKEKETVCEICVVLMQKLSDMPPVTLQPKTGHWIYDEEYSDWYYINYKCSCCKRVIAVPYEIRNEVYKEYPYCHCGAKMIEP